MKLLLVGDLILDEPDPGCDLDCVPNTARTWRSRVSLSTSLGFGGCNAALVLVAGDEVP